MLNDKNFYEEIESINLFPQTLGITFKTIIKKMIKQLKNPP